MEYLERIGRRMTKTNDLCFSCRNLRLAMPMGEKKCLAFGHTIHASEDTSSCELFSRLAKNEKVKETTNRSIMMDEEM